MMDADKFRLIKLRPVKSIERRLDGRVFINGIEEKGLIDLTLIESAKVKRPTIYIYIYMCVLK